MIVTDSSELSIGEGIENILPLLCCPVSGEPLTLKGKTLISRSGRSYNISDKGIPEFANEFLSEEAGIQQQHYDKVSEAYLKNMEYPHTREYMKYLDNVLLQAVGKESLGITAEICCGGGESFPLFGDRMSSGVGVDISLNMLTAARDRFSSDKYYFIQGDATRLPLNSDSFDTVFMLGGIHHVPDRLALFNQVGRILKPGGRFIWREPVSDFWLWRFLRGIIYHISPMLDQDTERPLLYKETEPFLTAAGFDLRTWRTCGFIGFCLLMNSDVLFFNRTFRFIPGIRTISRLAAGFDDWVLRLPGLQRAGLQVVGVAVTKEN